MYTQERTLREDTFVSIIEIEKKPYTSLEKSFMIIVNHPLTSVGGSQTITQ